MPAILKCYYVIGRLLHGIRLGTPRAGRYFFCRTANPVPVVSGVNLTLSTIGLPQAEAVHSSSQARALGPALASGIGFGSQRRNLVSSMKCCARGQSFAWAATLT